MKIVYTITNTIRKRAEAEIFRYKRQTRVEKGYICKYGSMQVYVHNQELWVSAWKINNL